MTRRLALILLAFPGVAVAQTGDCINPVAQVELTYCAEVAFQAADADLNAAYKAARAVLRDLDLNLPVAQRGAEAVLREAQRSWIAFRDQACKAEAYVWQGGSGQGMAYAGCRARLTNARAADLWALGEGF